MWIATFEMSREGLNSLLEWDDDNRKVKPASVYACVSALFHR